MIHAVTSFLPVAAAARPPAGARRPAPRQPPMLATRPMVLQLQQLLLLPAAAFELAAASDPTPSPSTAPVAAVLQRVLGDKTAGVFELHIDTTMAQGFKLENVAPRPAAAGGGSAAIISVTASSSPELAYGAAYYLRTYARFLKPLTGRYQEQQQRCAHITHHQSRKQLTPADIPLHRH